MFEKKKEESDDDFFQTFENLKLEKETKKNSVIVEENLSIKEDNLEGIKKLNDGVFHP